MFSTLFCFLILFALYLAQEPQIRLIPYCPSNVQGTPRLQLTSVISIRAIARCKNGDTELSAISPGQRYLAATFRDGYTGTACQFYKMPNSHFYTLHIEIGWGDVEHEIFENPQIRLVTCSYNRRGRLRLSKEIIVKSFIAPQGNLQKLKQSETEGNFVLTIVDIFGKEISADNYNRAKKVRLQVKETSGRMGEFMMQDCDATNGVTRYSIFTEGCGDGLVFPKTSGFRSQGSLAYSPYFEVFRLPGRDAIKFECNLTACRANCVGDSCIYENRRRREMLKRKDVEIRSAEVGPSSPKVMTLHTVLLVSDSPSLHVAKRETIPFNIWDSLAQNKTGKPDTTFILTTLVAFLVSVILCAIALSLYNFFLDYLQI